MIIDRSFAEDPPACLLEEGEAFQFPDEQPWGVQGAAAVGEITDQDRCIEAGRKWIQSEISARNKVSQQEEGAE